MGIKVDELCRSEAGRQGLEESIFETVKNDVERLSDTRHRLLSPMVYNREFTEKLAYAFKRAGLGYQVAMTTPPAREDIDDLMDEENIVWLIVDDRGKCYIPLNDKRLERSMVGRKATTIDFSNKFIIE